MKDTKAIKTGDPDSIQPKSTSNESSRKRILSLHSRPERSPRVEEKNGRNQPREPCVADSEESGSEPRDPLDIRSCVSMSTLGYYDPDSPDTKYACAGCGCSFVRLGSLNRHLRTCAHIEQQQHRQEQICRMDSEGRFACYGCKKVYLSRASLNRHRRANCPGARIAICGICDREFPTHAVMMLHRGEHFRDKPTN